MNNKLIPFTLETEIKRQITCFDFYENYAFAGTNYNGTVLKSLDRFNWEAFFQTEDVLVSSIYFANGNIYIGTSPNGYIYSIDLITYEKINYGSFGSDIAAFIYYKDKTLAFCNGKPKVLSLNLENDLWEEIYFPLAKINKVKIISDILYVILESGNILTYNGKDWNKIIFNQNSKVNFLSMRSIPQEIADIDRFNVLRTENEEVKYSIFPPSPNIGIGSIESTGNIIFYGSSNHSRLYAATSDNNIKKVFETDGNGIKNILCMYSNTISSSLSRDISVITSDSKIYLLYQSPEPSTINSSATVDTTTVSNNSDDISSQNTVNNKNINITYPQKGANFVIETEENITWESTKSVGDYIKIELLKNGEVYTIIANKIENSGEYNWFINPNIPFANNYQIRLTWLSASNNPLPENIDTSEYFSILGTVESTTTTTTRLNTADLIKMVGIPILDLHDENINTIAKDLYTNCILIGTDKGRILSFNKSTLNANMTGNRTVYVDIKNGNGYSAKNTAQYLYGLYKKLATIDSEKRIKEWRYNIGYGPQKTEEISATFLSPIYSVKNDFGVWQNLVWNETKPQNTTIRIYLRTATSEKSIINQDWTYCTYSTDGEVNPITKSLNNVWVNGNFIQMKVVMTTTTKNISPIISDITLSYTTRRSTYFFTTMFSLDNNSAQNGLLIANMTRPKNTEIVFGINSNDKTEWKEYQIVDLEKYFSIADWKNIKVGIKFTSFDESIPTVDEFALLLGSDSMKLLN
jgi:hypothetical protein